MQAPKLLRVAAWALAAASVLAVPSARAEYDGDPSRGIVRRAELDGPFLKLCVERGDRYDTLIIDREDPDPVVRFEPGCGSFGDGIRLEILDSDRARDAVHVDGDIAVYVDPEGNVLRIPLEPANVERAPEDPPYEDPDEGAECDPYGDPRYEGSCERYERDRYDAPRRRRSNRVVLPGPRAGEIGEVATAGTLGVLEKTLDPITEPALALTLRGATAAVGVAVGAVLYVPTTILDVLDTEYGEAYEEEIECRPYERECD
jgi:hypothetical protein